MPKKYKKIIIKKYDQNYLSKIIFKYPGINSGRKNYSTQFKRVLKNLLMSKAYDYCKEKNIKVNFKSFVFKDKKEAICLKFKI